MTEQRRVILRYRQTYPNPTARDTARTVDDMIAHDDAAREASRLLDGATPLLLASTITDVDDDDHFTWHTDRSYTFTDASNPAPLGDPEPEIRPGL